MEDCCAEKSCAVEQLRYRQSATLRAVLTVNAVMFGVEFVAGLATNSIALLADSLDMLGDALVYAFSLYVVARNARWKARAAVAKAGVMAVFGIAVAAEVIYKALHAQMPSVEGMSVVAVLALLANAGCFAALWRHRSEDINMRSVWLCSRNDLIANASVLLAAGAVLFFRSPWPDLLVGAGICALFLRSASVVAAEAFRELRYARQGAPAERAQKAAVGR